jgi:glycerate kinase
LEELNAINQVKKFMGHRVSWYAIRDTAQIDTPVMVINLDHYAAKIKEYLKKEVKDQPGAGAGAGLMAFLNAKMVRGIDVVMQYMQLEEKIKDADFVLTGEGSIDRQIAFGKTISGVLDLAKKYQKPVLVFAGNIAKTSFLFNPGITSVFGILPSVATLEEALKCGKENLEQAVYSVTRLIAHTSNLSSK